MLQNPERKKKTKNQNMHALYGGEQRPSTHSASRRLGGPEAVQRWERAVMARGAVESGESRITSGKAPWAHSHSHQTGFSGRIWNNFVLSHEICRLRRMS